MRRPSFDEDDDDFTIYCSACGAEIHTWMGQSVVECPKCGKVML